jgi:hypothetical protein
MNYRAMANGYVLPYDDRSAGVAVYLAMFLYARTLSDPHLGQVRPDDRIGPDAAAFVNDDIADDDGLWRDIA